MSKPVIRLAACALLWCAVPAPVAADPPPLIEAPRSPTTFSPDDEAVYQQRFARLLEAMRVRSGLANYDPLEPVPGATNTRPLPRARKSVLSAEAQQTAREYAAARNSSALVVMRKGRIELEQYFGDTNTTSLINSQSMAKPVTALAIGRAIRLGHLASLDQPVAEIITEWKGDPVREKILIRHLLDMRTGLLPQDIATSPDDILNRAYLHPRHDEVIIRDYPATHQPGTRYEYSNANAELVAPLIERATGMRYAQFIGEHLLKPIGAAGGMVWVNREGGVAHSGCCLLLPAESWLRLGMLIMSDGVWERTALLPDGYVAEMRTATAENQWYGLGLWVAGQYTTRRGFAHPDVPVGKVLHSEPYADKDIVLFDGNGNQVLVMVPSQDMLILRTGATPPKDAEWDNSLLPNLLIADLVKGGHGPAPEPQPVPASCNSVLAGTWESLAVTIGAEAGRAVPMRVYHPARPGRYPVVAFSHGAFATPERYEAMLGPLAAAGLIVIAPQHIDSEAFGRTSPPPLAENWTTRHADLALAITAEPAVDQALRARGIAPDRARVVAMGHSYGALIAQIAGGARGIEPDGADPDRRQPAVAAVVGWSPPGAMPGLMQDNGWASMDIPALTITGTADVLPGFIDDWQAHRASFEHAPRGKRQIWIGEGVDHYFGGVFGRIKEPDAASRALFARALTTTLAFIQRHLGMNDRCAPGMPLEGEQVLAD